MNKIFRLNLNKLNPYVKHIHCSHNLQCELVLQELFNFNRNHVHSVPVFLHCLDLLIHGISCEQAKHVGLRPIWSTSHQTMYIVTQETKMHLKSRMSYLTLYIWKSHMILPGEPNYFHILKEMNITGNTLEWFKTLYINNGFQLNIHALSNKQPLVFHMVKFQAQPK